MNILHTECGLNWGGQEYRTLLEHQYLNVNGHQSWLMCHPDSQLFIKATAAKAINVVGINLTKTWRLDIAVRIFLFCRHRAIDIINTHGSRDSTHCVPSWFFGIPVIRSRQCIQTIQKSFSYQKLCTHILASAEKIKTTMIDAGVSANKITVINEGVDLTEYTPHIDSQYLRDEFNVDKSNSVIINIGMLRDDKGQRYYLDAARLLLKERPHLKFFLIGESLKDNQLETELRSKIHDYGIADQFSLTGYRSDIAAFMNLADLVVISSTEEAQSRIAPQAFACAKTVVATNIGGLPEVVKHGENGLLVNAKDAPALAAGIASLLDKPILKARLEQNAYEFAKTNLSFDRMMQAILATYKQYSMSRTPR